MAGGFGAKDNGLLLKAIPDADLDALGHLLIPGEAALVVVGEDSVRHSIELSRLTPLRTSIQTGHGTYADLEGEVMAALNAHTDDTQST